MASLDDEYHSPSSIIDEITEQTSDICQYLELEMLDNCSKNGYKFCALHINIHSVLAKLDELKHIIFTLHKQNIIVHFIMLCETFLNDANEHLCKLDGYNLICKNRKNGSRGGVAIFANTSIPYKIRDDLALNVDNEFESLFIECQYKMTPVVVGEIYRIPNSNVKLSIERFHTIMNRLKSIKSDIILGTDQNFDLLKYNSDNNTKELLDGFISSGLLPTITKPTRITHKSATLIDNIYLKGCNCYTYSANIINYDISDHLPVIIYAGKAINTCKPESKAFDKRTWSDDALSGIMNDMLSWDWTNLESDSLDEAFDLFSKRMQISIEKNAPLKTGIIPPNQVKREPWMTKGLMTSARSKHKLFKKSIGKPKEHRHAKQYLAYKTIFNKAKRKAKLLYTNSILLSCKNNAKQTWDFINRTLGKTHNKKCTVDLLTVNDTPTNSPKEIAKHFCEFFADVGKKQSDKIGNISNCKTAEDYLNDINHGNSIYLYPTDAVEITDIVSKLKSKNSFGHDNLSTNILKKIINGILHPLTILINRSLSEGIFPEYLKLAKVIPVYKKGEHDKLDNYRPISLLTSVSKVLERVIFIRLFKFLESNHLFDPSQFGFRPKHSTIDAITVLVNDILDSFDKKHFTMAAFCDLSKAFDTIQHDILLYKLSRYGIRGTALKLIASYLHNRKHYVQIGKYASEITKLPAFGVPQGSILGPLLFIIYINDLNKALKHSKHLLFADDTTLYNSGANLETLSKLMNRDLEFLSAWFKANKLALNVAKTNYIIFSNRKDNVSRIKICIDGNDIGQVTNTKFLGIYLDELMKWEVHTKYVAKKVSSGLYALNSLKFTMPSCILKTLYYGLIHPHLTYGCLLWGNTYKKYLHRIEILQKKAIRTVSHAKYNAASSILFKGNAVLRFQDIYKYLTCQVMFKLYTGTVPEPLMGLLPQNLNLHNLNTRHRGDFVIKLFKNNIVQNSFIAQGPKLWNALSPNLKSLSYKCFCQKLKHSYLGQY